MIDVWFGPPFPDVTLDGVSVAVIDVFRSGGTAAAALEGGCREVRFCREVEEVREGVRREREAGRVGLAGGERRGVAPEGFDFGNSPLEYDADRLADGTLYFTSTNGVAALERMVSTGATAVYLAGLGNRRATAQRLAGGGEEILLVCSGTDGRFSLEDLVCAGAIVEELPEDLPRSDGAEAALSVWKDREGRLAPLAEKSRGGRNLQKLGFDRDIDYCLQTDIFPFAVRILTGPLRGVKE